MDYHVLFDIAIGVVNLAIAALAYVLWQNLRDVRDESKKSSDALSAHELYCARTYVTNDGLVKAISDLKSDLKESIAALVAEMKQNNENSLRNFRDVFAKIDGKQDKQ